MNEHTIASIYTLIAAGCGFSNPPRLEFEPLGGRDVARFETLTAGRGLNARTVDQRVVVDLAQMSALDQTQVTAILAHELAHWICRYKTTTGGDQSPDGGWHGARFLAAWLWIWRKLGRSNSDIADEAAWHAQAYGLHPAHMQRAMKAAIGSSDLDIVLENARPVMSRRAEALMWLRAAGWLALFGAFMAVWRDMPISALMLAGMTFGCWLLIRKFKRMPAAVSGAAA